MVKAKTKKTKVKKTTVTPKKAKKATVKKTVVKRVAKKPASKPVAKKAVAKKTEPAKKSKIAKKGKDTGSVEVQIDNFTVKIKYLIKHLKKHGQDNDSRRGLLIMVGKRRRLLNYIKKSDPKRYANIVKKLKLKE